MVRRKVKRLLQQSGSAARCDSVARRPVRILVNRFDDAAWGVAAMAIVEEGDVRAVGHARHGAAERRVRRRLDERVVLEDHRPPRGAGLGKGLCGELPDAVVPQVASERPIPATGLPPHALLLCAHRHEGRGLDFRRGVVVRRGDPHHRKEGGDPQPGQARGEGRGPSATERRVDGQHVDQWVRFRLRRLQLVLQQACLVPRISVSL
mmetsp:Transcript_68132/g.197496  ORF Transcript_68132/g.197496 Transcript_68132/m.197496 type:complete len:207 (+) Transcript_68132:250-870(+)